MLGEHEAKLSNTPSEAGSLLDQVDAQAGICQVESSAHTTNTTANDHGCSGF
jgi:hypothetical protein